MTSDGGDDGGGDDGGGDDGVGGRGWRGVEGGIGAGRRNLEDEYAIGLTFAPLWKELVRSGRACDAHLRSPSLFFGLPRLKKLGRLVA